MANVSLQNLEKTYPEKNGPGIKVVHGINLEIKDKEFMVLVGPSGCGKSTTLRMIAGLEEITGGTISIDGREVNNVLPKDRDIAMVFQNYALYPHMTVFENMAFGLKLRKFSKAEINQRVQEAAGMLGLEPYLQRKPKALSGGQRQRVAVGRAIVRKPKVFLFDEPLSNLDAKMRSSTRTEISKLHARLGATMIYVTHDQIEAMTMGDRICVMKDGRIMQVAPPLELYNHPANLFVAGFIGSPPMNFFRGRLQPSTTPDLLDFVENAPNSSPVRFTLNPALSRLGRQHLDQELVFGIRPENVLVSTQLDTPRSPSEIEVNVEVSEPMGSETYLHLGTGATNFIARVQVAQRFEIGQRLRVSFKLESAHLFDAKTENVLG